MTLVNARYRGPRVPAGSAPSPARNRTNAAWLRDEVAALRTRIMFGPGLLDLADIVRAMAEIGAGENFRDVLK